MKYRIVLVALLAGVSLTSTPSTFAQTTPISPPALLDAEKPIRISGLGLKVSDLERSKKFYTDVLGLKSAPASQRRARLSNISLV